MIYRRYPLIHRKFIYPYVRPNPRYAAKTPGYGYDPSKEKTEDNTGDNKKIDNNQMPKSDSMQKHQGDNKQKAYKQKDSQQKTGKLTGIEKIPLPNEPDIPEDVLSPGRFPQPGASGITRKKRGHPSPFLSILRKRIGLEEIIILGLILLLLNEETRDDILLVILVYILLT